MAHAGAGRVVAAGDEAALEAGRDKFGDGDPWVVFPLDAGGFAAAILREFPGDETAVALAPGGMQVTGCL